MIHRLPWIVVLPVVAVFAVASHANWCGHGQEFIPVPDVDGWCWMIPVLGQAV